MPVLDGNWVGLVGCHERCLAEQLANKGGADAIGLIQEAIAVVELRGEAHTVSLEEARPAVAIRERDLQCLIDTSRAGG